MPNLQTMQEPDPAQRRRLGAAYLLAALLLAMLPLLIWLTPRHAPDTTDSPMPAAQPRAVRVPSAAVAEPGAPERIASAQRKGKAAKANAAGPNSASSGAGGRAPSAVASRPADVAIIGKNMDGTGKTAAVEPPRPQPGEKNIADLPQSLSAQTTPNINELDVSISRQLPSIVLSGHVYSNRSADRIVMINNRMYHEGAQIEAGLTLERIIPSGVVFDFHGHRFQMNLMQTWSDR